MFVHRPTLSLPTPTLSPSSLLEILSTSNGKRAGVTDREGCRRSTTSQIWLPDAPGASGTRAVEQEHFPPQQILGLLARMMEFPAGSATSRGAAPGRPSGYRRRFYSSMQDLKSMTPPIADWLDRHRLSSCCYAPEPRCEIEKLVRAEEDLVSLFGILLEEVRHRHGHSAQDLAQGCQPMGCSCFLLP